MKTSKDLLSGWPKRWRWWGFLKRNGSDVDNLEEPPPAAELAHPASLEIAETTRGNASTFPRQISRSNDQVSTNISTSASSKKQTRKWYRDEVFKTRMYAVILFGGFLVGVFTLYLGLIITDPNRTQYFHLIMIIVIIIASILFCHALARLFMATGPQKSSSTPANSDIESTFTSAYPGQFVEFSRPIRVEFLEDAERRGDKNATAVPPPAYGIWWNTVRVNPNRIYWAPRMSRPATPVPAEESAGEGDRRPPSYISLQDRRRRDPSPSGQGNAQSQRIGASSADMMPSEEQRNEDEETVDRPDTRSRTLV